MICSTFIMGEASLEAAYDRIYITYCIMVFYFVHFACCLKEYSICYQHSFWILTNGAILILLKPKLLECNIWINVVFSSKREGLKNFIQYGSGYGSPR